MAVSGNTRLLACTSSVVFDVNIYDDLFIWHLNLIHRRSTKVY